VGFGQRRTAATTTAAAPESGEIVCAVIARQLLWMLWKGKDIQTTAQDSRQRKRESLSPGSAVLTPKPQAYDREISISIDIPFCNLDKNPNLYFW
jgi:hypothetical protein